MRVLTGFVMTGILLLVGCGGNSSQPSSSSAALAGNWQIALTPSDQTTFQPRNLSGFVLQRGGTLTGSLSFLIPNVQNPSSPPCAGAAPIRGTVSGQTLNLSVSQNGQVLTLTGNTSSDGSSMGGNYSSSDGVCEPGESGTWAATLIRPVSGLFSGFFHSTSSTSYNLQDKDFQVSGNLIQSTNTGATSATVTGFITASNYQCFSSAALNGTVSGSTLRLSIIGDSGLQIGEMGAAVGSQVPGGATVSPDGLTIIGSNTAGTGYFIGDTKPCPFVLSSFDFGNFCLNLGNATTCTDPLLASLNNMVFPTLLVGDVTGPTAVVTLTNQASGVTAQPFGVTISITGLTGADSPSDFNIVSQTCDTTQPSPPPQGPLQVTIASQASCTVSVKFVPTGSCPMDPTAGPPAKCPLPRTAQLQLADSLDPTVDPNNPHAVSLMGFGNSAVVPSVGELDFLPSQANTSQTVTFTNQSQSPTGEIVSILPTTLNSSSGQPCTYPTSQGTPSGLQVVDFINSACDGIFNTLTVQQNFTLQADNCSGKVLNPGDTCTLGIEFTPQTTGLIRVFLQINSSEPDTGRFPIELRGNVAAVPAPAAVKVRHRVR